MINIVSLLAAAALVSLQCSYEANAQLDNTKIDLDNNLQPNIIPTQRRRLRKFVRITGPPPERARFLPGTRLVLECEVMGSPAPTVQWLKNGEPVTEYEDETNEIPTHHPTSIACLTSKLVINSASNGDVFTCVGTSGTKEDSVSTTIYSNDEESPKLLTLEKLFRVPSKPIITAFYNNVFQEIGTTLIMPCRVHSFTDHQILWQDNNGDVVYSGSRIRVLPSGDLLIAGLRWADMGEWACTAKNMYGVDTTTTFLYPVKPRQQNIGLT
ncbi:neural/ectodermal development factor IMP-L2-like [Battus philenor]|uniref:neural/ectodermal development factor IMP-L2-like n=1 Tax=Battus philenor TaxID=42288 RepID=UPI0035CE886F